MEGLQSWVTNHQFTNIGTIWATIVATSMAYTSAKRDAFKPNVRYTSCIEAFKQFIFISMVILYVFVCHYRMHALGLTLVDQLSVEFKPIRVYSYIEWQVDELEKAISEAARDPAKYGIDQPELERRFKWTRAAMTQLILFRRC
ncbi:uncharacterized protein LOC111914044 isoform X1 [Lactuca sativa]|uniref:uncharacterized protein LOC111914044 isoform X1 n=1 Tax=Lactuca sativa TaxID=4236 RepID=UPI0022AFAD4A|nr:uncharacterized protein LOC111914044 isoform X1 [Lactuca sativa]XP_052625386.1 uncharacterized protein LOC111914044 isoform X1 [Lactuca sativa]